MMGQLLPQRQDKLFGHKKELARFVSALERDHIHHAWLINGPANIGKATFAYIIARTLISAPDNPTAIARLKRFEFAAYEQTKADALKYIFVIEPENAKHNRQIITVNSVRALHKFLRYKPIKTDKYNIVIIDKADYLNNNAINAILKNLEEPPDNTLFFIIADSIGRLPATFRSRCLSLPLAPLNHDDMRQAVDAFSAKPGNIDLNPDIMSFVAGRSGLAYKLLNDSETRDIYKNLRIIIKNANPAPKTMASFITEFISEITTDNNNFILFMELVLHYLAGNIDRLLANDNKYQLARLTEIWKKVNDYYHWALGAHNLDKKSVATVIIYIVANYHKSTINFIREHE